MKKSLTAVIIVLVLTLSGCAIFSNASWYSGLKHFGISRGDFPIISEVDNHGGFHGDGDCCVILDCSKDKDKALDIVSEWDSLPLSENLQLIMYGGEKDGVSYEFNLAEAAGIPQVTNGYYCFYDRHSESSDSADDSELLSRASYNFSLAIYDTDTDTLYYFEFDT